jgi:DNA processing protein
MLCVRGPLPTRARAVAIVGSRAASPYGIARARELASDLVRCGYTVVSGLARGIDAAAHRGALEAGGPSMAVLPGGLAQVTPPDHADLAEALVRAGGALVAEWPDARPPKPGMFLRRNRLIAALSAATVVVEAAERSGALSTAAVARKLGRPLLAVPGDADRPTARGTNALIKSGARLCERAGDVFEALAESGAGADSTLIAALDAEGRTLDALAVAARLTVEQTLAALLRLEWAGAARALPGQRWAKGSR